VLRLWVYDRTNFDSKGYRLRIHYDIGFCLVEHPVESPKKQ
jgi:hypothetical protein